MLINTHIYLYIIQHTQICSTSQVFPLSFPATHMYKRFRIRSPFILLSWLCLLFPYQPVRVAGMKGRWTGRIRSVLCVCVCARVRVLFVARHDEHRLDFSHRTCHARLDRPHRSVSHTHCLPCPAAPVNHDKRSERCVCCDYTKIKDSSPKR